MLHVAVFITDLAQPLLAKMPAVKLSASHLGVDRGVCGHLLCCELNDPVFESFKQEILETAEFLRTQTNLAKETNLHLKEDNANYERRLAEWETSKLPQSEEKSTRLRIR